MKPKLTKLWMDEWAGTCEQTIRADFSNDRHYEVVIARPANKEQIAFAMMRMARMIGTDPQLTNNY